MGGLSRFNNPFPLKVKATETIAMTPPEFLIPAGRRLHAGDGVNAAGEATTFNRFEGELLQDGYGLRTAAAMISPLDNIYRQSRRLRQHESEREPGSHGLVAQTSVPSSFDHGPAPGDGDLLVVSALVLGLPVVVILAAYLIPVRRNTPA
jgi:hypothetical protein